MIRAMKIIEVSYHTCLFLHEVDTLIKNNK